MSESPATTVSSPQRGSLLAGACLLYLLLPNVLFLAGWVQPWLAWPLIVLLSFGCFHLWRRLGDLRPVHGAGERLHMAVVLLAGAVVTYLVGFNGDFPQSADFIVRNAVYDTLVRSDWPLHSARGEYFVYYHAFWLPPAFASKCLGGVVPPLAVLVLWVYAGVVLISLCLFRRLGRRTLSFLVVMMGLACMQEVLGRADVIARYLPVQGAVDAYCRLVPRPLYYVGMWHQLVSTYNHGIMVVLFMAMVHGRVLRGAALLPVAALLVVSSPLGAVAVLVYLVFLQLPRWRQLLLPLFRQPLLYAALVLLPVLGLYFGSGEGSRCVPAWQGYVFAGKPLQLAVAYVLGSLCIMLPLAVCGWRYRRTAGFRAAAALFLLLPWIWLGVDNNELMLKGTAVAYFFTAVFMHGRWPHAGRTMRCCILLLFAASAYIPFLDIQHRLREFGTSEQQHESNIQNEWQGHLDHPEHHWYSRFWGKEAPLFYKK